MSGQQAARVIAAGLSPLVPLPWVDGVLARRMLADSFAAEAKGLGMVLDAEALAVLTRAHPWRVSNALRGAGKWSLRRLVGLPGELTQIKRVFDGTAEAALRVEMVRMALVAGQLPGRAVEVRAWMDAAIGGERHSPLGRAALRTGLGKAPERWGPEEDRLSAAVGQMLDVGDGPQVLARFAHSLRSVQVASTAR